MKIVSKRQTVTTFLIAFFLIGLVFAGQVMATGDDNFNCDDRDGDLLRYNCEQCDSGNPNIDWIEDGDWVSYGKAKCCGDDSDEYYSGGICFDISNGWGTLVDSCEFEINSSGNYYFGADLDCEDRVAIEINVSNVSIDGDGFVISGVGASNDLYNAIEINSGAHDVSIASLDIVGNYRSGIYLEWANNFQGSDLYINLSEPIVMKSCVGGSISDSRLRAANNAIHIYNGENVEISKNDFEYAGLSVKLENSNNCTVDGNNITFNMEQAMLIEGDNNIITNNTANSAIGFIVDGDNNLLSGNSNHGSTGQDILVQGGRSNNYGCDNSVGVCVGCQENGNYINMLKDFNTKECCDAGKIFDELSGVCSSDTEKPIVSNVVAHCDSGSDSCKYDDDFTAYLTWDVTDNVGIDNCFAEIGDSSPDESAGNDGLDAYIGAEGNNIYYVRCVDEAGNESEILSDNVFIDLHDPVANTFSLQEEETCDGEDVRVNWSVSDNGAASGKNSGIDRVELWRMDMDDDWGMMSSKVYYVSGYGTENLSGSFTLDSEDYENVVEFGIHVVDNVGRWSDEGDAGLPTLPFEVVSKDLQVVDFYFPNNPVVPNQDLNVTVNIKNVGTTAITKDFNVKLYLDGNLKEDKDVSNDIAGGQTLGVIFYDIDYAGLSGETEVEVVIDGSGTGECNINNNSYNDRIDIDWKNLKLTDIEMISSGGESQINFTVRNDAQVSVTEEFSAKYYIDNVLKLTEKMETDVPAGNTNVPFYFSMKWPEVLGNHTVKVEIDTSNDVFENNESDNVLTENFSIGDTDSPSFLSSDVSPTGEVCVENVDKVFVSWSAHDEGVSELDQIQVWRNGVEVYTVENINNSDHAGGWTDNNISCNEDYEYFIRAVDGAGNQTDSSTYPVRVSCTPVAVGVVGEPFTMGGLYLNIDWPNVSMATSYDLYRCSAASSAGDCSLPGSSYITGLTVSEYNELASKLNNCHNYKYWYTASNTCGDTSEEYIGSYFHNVGCAGPSIDFDPNGLETTNNIDVEVTIDSTENIVTRKYYWTNSTNACSFSGSEIDLSSNQDTVTQTQDGEWYLCAQAVDSNSQESIVKSEKYIKDSQNPNKTTVSIDPAGDVCTLTTSPEISWTAVSDNGASGIDHYEVWRSVDGNSFFKVYETSNNTTLTWQDTGLSCGSIYEYGVHTVDGLDNWSSEVSTVSITVNCTTSAPTNFQASGTGDDTTTLSWSSASNADSYDLYRCTGSNCEIPNSATYENISGISYIDSTLQSCTDYRFWIESNSDDCQDQLNNTPVEVTTSGCVVTDPDLIIESNSISFDGIFCKDIFKEVELEITNQGNENISNSFDNDIALGSDSCSVGISSLNLGDSQIVSCNVTPVATNNSLSLVASTDSDDDISESNESNNSDSVTGVSVFDKPVNSGLGLGEDASQTTSSALKWDWNSLTGLTGADEYIYELLIGSATVVGPEVTTDNEVSFSGLDADQTYTLSLIASNDCGDSVLISDNATTDSVLIADFTLEATVNQITIQSGDDAVFELVLTSVNGFDDVVDLSCADKPTGSSCSFSESNVDLSTTAIVDLTIYDLENVVLNDQGMMFIKQALAQTIDNVITVRGTSGSIVHDLDLYVVVEDGLLPDLVIESMTLDNDVCVGDVVTVSSVIKNQGEEIADNTENRFKAEHELSLSGSLIDTLDESWLTTPLAIDGSLNINFNWDTGSGSLAPGIYSVEVAADSETSVLYQIVESSESNNTESQSVVVDDAVVIQNLAKASGDEDSITWSWESFSGAEENNLGREYDIYIDSVYEDTVTNATYQATGFNCGESHTIVVQTNGNCGFAEDSLVSQTDACVSTMPNITINSFADTSSSYICSGDTRTFEVEIENDGASDIVDAFHNEFVLADNSDSCSKEVTGLAVGETNDLSCDITINTSLENINLNLGIDDLNDISENNESDNSDSIILDVRSVPDKVQNLSLLNSEQTSITWGWDHLDTADEYLIYINGDFQEIITENEYSIFSLDCAGSYQISVVASNDCDTSSEASELTSETAACGALNLPDFEWQTITAESSSCSVGSSCSDDFCVGSLVGFRAELENIGDADANPSGGYFVNEAVTENGVGLGVNRVNELGSGETENNYFVWDTDGLTVGSYTITFNADVFDHPQHRIAESSEINNSKSLTVDIVDCGGKGVGNNDPVIADLEQFDVDGAMTESQTTSDTNPYFNFDVSDSDTGDKIGYQYQITPNCDNFDQKIINFIWFGDTTNPRSFEYRIPDSQDLSLGNYCWRARAVDDQLGKSDWEYFGLTATYDFEVGAETTGTLESNFSYCSIDGNILQFIDLSTEGSYTRSWDFGDGDICPSDCSETGYTASSEYPVHAFEEQSFASTDLVWYSTLNSDADIVSPEVGTSGSINGTPTYRAATYGNGVLIDNNGEGATTVSSVFNPSEGAIQVWYTPDFDSDSLDSTSYFIFRSDGSTQDTIELMSLYGGFYYKFNDEQGNDCALSLYNLSPGWTAGQTLKLVAKWRNNNTIELYMDDVLLGSRTCSMNFSNDLEIDDEIHIGNWFSGSSPASGVLDEFMVFDKADYTLTGGSVPVINVSLTLTDTESNEYLSTKSINFNSIPDCEFDWFSAGYNQNCSEDGTPKIELDWNSPVLADNLIYDDSEYAVYFKEGNASECEIDSGYSLAIDGLEEDSYEKGELSQNTDYCFKIEMDPKDPPYFDNIYKYVLTETCPIDLDSDVLNIDRSCGSLVLGWNKMVNATKYQIKKRIGDLDFDDQPILITMTDAECDVSNSLCNSECCYKDEEIIPTNIFNPDPVEMSHYYYNYILGVEYDIEGEIEEQWLEPNEAAGDFSYCYRAPNWQEK
jgi:hypothetical protein